MLNRLPNNKGRALLTGLRRGWSGLRVLLALTVLLVAAAGQAGAQDEDFDYKSQTLRVGVWMEDKQDGEVLQKGEKFSVGFQANQDAYAVVYHIDTDGVVSVLWPRSRFDDGFVFGTHEYLLPVSGARRLVSGASPGEGYVEAIVSSYPFDLRDLELDFHHEYTDNPLNFRVAGDPFLAMNEVNYVVTGLKDSEDFVVTNYLSYYVHEKVDHPRFLCNQCHLEEDVAYHPYQDKCTLEIQYDYGWNNNWYDTYGYYPVYSNPVYVYVDPWTWRPWVNFWYDPWYTCAPTWGWGWGWGYGCYTWCDSPYYWGNCYNYYDRGYRRYGPLDRNYAASGTRTKTREYSRVTSLVGKEAPSDSQRSAMRARSTVVDGRTAVDRSNDARFRGTDRTVRERTRIETNVQVRGNSGLRIRDNTTVRGPDDSGRSAVRHTAGGRNSSPSLTPVSRGNTRSDRGHTAVRANQPSGSRDSADKPASSRVRSNRPSTGDRTIKTVEPHKKGTRIWNSGQGGSSSDRTGRTPTVNSGSRNRSSDTPSRSNVRSRSGGSENRSTVRPPARTKSSGGSRATTPKAQPKPKSGGSTKSSPPQKSSGGKSGGSRRRG
jgi:hypothetical protein